MQQLADCPSQLDQGWRNLAFFSHLLASVEKLLHSFVFYYVEAQAANKVYCQVSKPWASVYCPGWYLTSKLQSSSVKREN